MATLLHAESKRLCSWWWDSHISPKNSKWLQENLTDMDVKVKSMIKLLEEDADSFARRAEMYYKKRPELMKLVEEFYRAYRALAERYDHATVELRQAHRTMEEAFPNQTPFVLAEDSHAGSSASEVEPHTPEMPHPIRALFELPDDLRKDAVGLSSHFQAIKRNGVYTEDNDAVTRKKGLKHLTEMFTFEEGADRSMFAEGRVRKGLNFQDEERNERSEHITHDESRDHRKHEVVKKEDNDSKTRSLQDEISRLLIENRDLNTQVVLESERVGKAETEVESLRQALSKLQAEKEAALLQYQQCLERLSNLEAEISCGQEEIGRLKDEILTGAMKLNGAEELCLLLNGANQSLQSEVDTLVQKAKMQQHELTSKHKELEKLSICIKDEHLHQLQAEAALESLQHLHSQSQEENMALKLELQQGVQMLKHMELMKQSLEAEVWQLEEVNHILNEQNVSSAVLMKNLQDEISSLKEMKGKLEGEAVISIHQINALQQELCCLKEEKDDVNWRYQDVIDQVKLVGLNVTCLQSLVKDLQDENLKLKEICQKNDDEKVALLEKLENLEMLSEKNMLLERSLLDASSELQGLRATSKTLEESYQSVQDENLKLKEICQKSNDKEVALLEKLEKLEKLSEKNMLLERSLSGTSAELQGLRATIKTLEESYQSLQDKNLELKGKNMLLENSLSDTSAEVQMLRATIKMLQESYHSLQDENLELKEVCQKNDDEKLVLLEELKNMEKVLEKNKLLENSLSDASGEVQGLSAKLKTFEESFNSIHDENLELKDICQKYDDDKLILLQKLESMMKVLEKNKLLENSLSDASGEVQELSAKLNTLEESFNSIHDENLELKKICQKNDDEKLILSQKLENMEKLLETNMLLEISLSDTSGKLKGLKETLKTLEESLQSLQGEKTALVTEKDVLVSQVESITLNMEKFSERNSLLENSLSYMNVEVEGLRAKSNNLEECCQSLQDEKSSLLAERNDLLSRVESIGLSLEDLVKRHKELENKHLGLEKDRELTHRHVDELQVFLNLERQKHADSVQSSKTQVVTLENQLHLLQEEAKWRKKDLEEEQDKVINAQIEIFVLQRCIHDIKDKNLSLSIKCQRYVDASTHVENLILELEKENLWQQEKVKGLLEQINKLKTLIHKVLKGLDIFMDDGYLDTIDEQVLCQHVLERIKSMKISILDVEDENQLLIFEKSIDIILLEQLRLEAYNLKKENYSLERESEIRNGELSMLQAENHGLLEKNKRSRLEEQAGIRREEVLRNEMENLHGQFSNLQETYQTLLDEHHKLLDENVSLENKINDLKEENHILLEENDGIFGEAMTQANLSLIFESISTEKVVVLKVLNDDCNHLCGFNSNLENVVREMVEKIGMVQTENLYLKESVEKLEEYESRSLILTDELNMIRNINDQLNHQIEIAKNLLSHKEVTLLQVHQELETTECENVELHKENEEYRTLEEHLELELVKKINEVELWERENAELLKEIKEHRTWEEHLESELLKKINEVELWERDVAAMYENLQVSVICASLFEEKALEQISNWQETYLTLLDGNHKLLDENVSLKNKINDLKEDNYILQEEIDGIFGEAMTQANLSLIFESMSTEKAMVLKVLNDDFICLCGFNSNLENVVNDMFEKMGMAEAKNLHLKESVEKLEEYKSHSLVLMDELNMIRNINNQLNNQIEIEKNLLSHKEVTLLQVRQNLEATQSDNVELHKEIEECRTLEEHLESELVKKINEVEIWERENAKLLKEIEERRTWEEHLESELLKKINEVEIWERDVAAMYEDLQVSVVRASLFEEKVLEQIAACESLRRGTIIEKQKFDDERALINSDFEELKRKVSVLEGDNLRLKAEMAAYLPLILSLKKSVSSLEYHTLSPQNVLAAGNKKLQDASVAMVHQNDMSCQELSEDHGVAAAAEVLELQKLQAQVQGVEKIVIEIMRLAMHESSNAKAKLEVAMEEIKELKIKGRSEPEDNETRKDIILLLEEGRERSKDLELQRNDVEVSQSKQGLTMKDIQLDHVSDSLSHGNSSYRMGQRHIAEEDDQMLELWETAEQDCNFKPTRKLPASVTDNEDVIECHQIEAVEEQKSEYPSSELQAEKELAVDEQEVSKTLESHQKETLTIVERLASDASRLMNLQTSVQELKKKTDKSNKSNQPAGFEYNNMKGQLKEVEESILQLVDINRKLTKNAADGCASDSKVKGLVGDMGIVRKRRVLERVGKSSEKIGRLELEVQRIQFMLLKLEDQHKSKGSKAVDRRTTVLLRDYLYGGRSSQGKKRVPCCACIRPATKGE